ncbi:TlpA family protein disulfide reductase [Pedobacter caeni]|uniref:Thiol-disulfide isomerase or thioredoxin n=1 Tax=Pedobacter caeni TaxID=288992 RepID=A0A1M4Z346_9SPHI|nr:TlpA disulfide reductase family protein [Pedobacter caeni]SHF12217.1 Thiol-disulfide isomerase or thioredoxin [Pedobacter caeni]
MKHIQLGLIFLLIALQSFAQQDSIVISGTLKGEGSHRLALSFQSEKKENYSQDLIGGKFSFKIKRQAEPVLAWLQLNALANGQSGTNEQSAGQSSKIVSGTDLFIFKSDLQISGAINEFEGISIQGDVENEGFMIFRSTAQPLITEDLNLRKQMMSLPKSDSLLLKALINKGQAVSMKIIAKQKTFIATYPDALLSWYLLGRMPNFYTADQYIACASLLSAKYRNTGIAKKVTNKVASLKSTAAGTMALNFKGTDQNGQAFELAAKRGKLILLDFWGSWCIPCRAGNPHLKMLSAKYKNMDFEIVGISNEHPKTKEERRAASVGAMWKDGIDWINLLNKDDTDIDVIKAYNITGFPTKILLDKNGKVVLRLTANATNDLDLALERYSKMGHF